MKKLLLIAVLAFGLLAFTGCGTTQSSANQAARQEMNVAHSVHMRLLEIQPMPTDIMASYERHNIIRCSYWINGMRERANNLVFPGPDIPIGYVVLFAPNGGIAGSFSVQGKVTSLNYSLVPYSEYWERGFNTGNQRNRWLPNPGGVFGTNTNGVFWFTPCGRYMEFNGTYLFSDIPFAIQDPMIHINIVDLSQYE